MSKLSEEFTYKELKEIYESDNAGGDCDCECCREYRRQSKEHDEHEE